MNFLFFSVNNISSLADFQFCTNLQDLFVRKNNISDLNEICYLQSLPKLRNLWLGENPCAEEEGSVLFKYKNSNIKKKRKNIRRKNIHLVMKND